MKLQKMEGLGNTFVITRGPAQITPEFVREHCSNVDGFLLVTRIDESRVQMDYWNADGSVAEMCGNGLRCAARFAVDQKLVEPGTFTVTTKARDLAVTWDGKNPDEIEVQVGRVLSEPNPAKIHDAEFYIASIGNPHAITFVNNVDTAPVTTIGPKVETDGLFPNKTNVEFVQIVDPNKIKLRVWERGVGETKACGTGMCASAIVARKHKSTKLPITIEVPGGSAKIWLDDSGSTRMLAPAHYL